MSAGAAPRLLGVNPTGLVSGAETVLVRVLEGAAAAGFETSCMSPPGPLEERLLAAGVAWLPLPDLKLGSGSRPAAATRLARRTALAVAALHRCAAQADVILANGFFALPALRLGRNEVPSVWLVHDVVERRSWLRVLRSVKGGVDLAVAVSDAAGEPLRRAGMEVVVRRNGTPWPADPIREAPTPVVVGCAGLLTSWKGQDVLLDAFAALGRDGVVLELAGGEFPKDGPYAEGLRRRAGREDLAGRVRFLGPVREIAARMRTWSILVSPSVEPEAGSLSILEAMSIGLPVVATHHGGTPEYLGGGGLLVPPGDPRALAVALGMLLDSPATWEACHQAGPALVAAHFRLDDQQRDMVEILRGVAEDPPGRRR